MLQDKRVVIYGGFLVPGIYLFHEIRDIFFISDFKKIIFSDFKKQIFLDFKKKYFLISKKNIFGFQKKNISGFHVTINRLVKSDGQYDTLTGIHSFGSVDIEESNHYIESLIRIVVVSERRHLGGGWRGGGGGGGRGGRPPLRPPLTNMSVII